jgi:2-polyprenyl-3-methyl-5-hydroxy-6-metoxy-1,4-benzoquinol methylase
MTQDFFARSGFSTPLARQDRFLPIVSARYAADAPLRLLDVGCGNGEQLFNLMRHFPKSEAVGIDISAANIDAAMKRVPPPDTARVEFLCADILSWDAAPFDVIISDSVVQNIPNTPGLLHRLASLLKPGALLLVTMPYDGIYNRLLWTLRRIARLLAGPRLEHVLLHIAQRLHPDWEISMIRERLGYMYLLPYSRDGKAFRVLAQEAGLRLTAVHALLHVSLAQPKHRLLVFHRDPA